jgi:hypothetical protein
MEYRAVSNSRPAREHDAAETAALGWLARRLCFEAWLARVREPASRTRRGLSAAA